MLLRVTLVMSFASGLVGCTSWRHSASLYQYRDQVLKVEGGRGVERLALEARYDSTIANWIAQNGDPDYIHVQSTDIVDLCYIGEDRLVTFTRAGAAHSIANVTEPIPDDIHVMFTHADRRRLVAQRATANALAAAPAHGAPAHPEALVHALEPEQAPAAPDTSEAQIPVSSLVIP